MMEALVAHLQALMAGLPSDHTNRMDARITALEEAVKSILQHLTANAAPPPDQEAASSNMPDVGEPDGGIADG
jgi:hypothetical protein